MGVCVCVKAPRNTVLHLPFSLWQKQDVDCNFPIFMFFSKFSRGFRFRFDKNKISIATFRFSCSFQSSAGASVFALTKTRCRLQLSDFHVLFKVQQGLPFSLWQKQDVDCNFPIFMFFSKFSRGFRFRFDKNKMSIATFRFSCSFQSSAGASVFAWTKTRCRLQLSDFHVLFKVQQGLPFSLWQKQDVDCNFPIFMFFSKFSRGFRFRFDKNKISIATFRFSCSFQSSAGASDFALTKTRSRLQLSDFHFLFEVQQGAKGDGGGLWPTKTPPPSRVNVPAIFFPKMASQEPQQFYRNSTSTNYKEWLW